MIIYLIKCLKYVFAKNKGTFLNIRKHLSELIPYQFGDHSKCHSRFCGFERSNSWKYPHSSLPYPLHDLLLYSKPREIVYLLLKILSYMLIWVLVRHANIQIELFFFFSQVRHAKMQIWSFLFCSQVRHANMQIQLFLFCSQIRHVNMQIELSVSCFQASLLWRKWQFRFPCIATIAYKNEGRKYSSEVEAHGITLDSKTSDKGRIILKRFKRLR